MTSPPNTLDALVIGAGPAGIGTALALAAVEDLTFGVLERGQIGQTFLDWPAEQTFLTPSFTGNGFGATDLNAIHPETSPAFSLGVDIACHHVEHGSSVTVVDGSTPWDAGGGSDPSFRLAPRSRIRLAAALDTGRLTLAGAHATGIKRDGDEWAVSLGNGKKLRAASRPIAATGYGPGLGPVEHLFSKREDGWPELDEDDQSTLAPGLFLSGPAIRHGGLKFCFVYKFRQRFAHIARLIGERAGKDTGALETWRAAGMLTDDLSCCGVECAC